MIRIFIIEDDRDTQIFLKFLLGRRYDLEFCDSAAAFFESIKTASCDLIIMDVKLQGDEDGFTITRRLKSSKEFSRIPILCLSAYVYEEFKQQAFSAGADYFLSKPVENGILLNTIEMLLNKNRTYFAAVI